MYLFVFVELVEVVGLRLVVYCFEFSKFFKNIKKLQMIQKFLINLLEN
jgi:hypothetical protein